MKVGILLRCIGPRGNDIFKSFTFEEGKSKDVYTDAIGKFESFCTKITNKIVKTHQLLSTRERLLVDEYVTSLHKIARDRKLGQMYHEFVLQARRSRKKV